MLSRMKYITRWSLMRNSSSENLSEHSLEVAVLAHALAVLRNRRFGGCVNEERAALLALFHDVPEILTGDMPTPVKYYSDEIRQAYKKVEQSACERLLGMLPDDLRTDYEKLICENENDKELHQLVKAADKLSALIKCIEERKAGNREFEKAELATLQSLRQMNLPEAELFLDEFLPQYSLTLDEQD